MKVYVVLGTNGKHDDWRSWIVCAYTDEAKARSHVEQAQTAMRQLAGHLQGAFLRAPFENVELLQHTGTAYWYEEIDLLETVPTT